MGTLAKTAGHHDLMVDETSCGPMCQHPSCWASNQRREKGFPLKRETSPVFHEEETELPSQTVYNMLEDYGDDMRDRFPAKHGGRAAHTRVSSSLPALPSSSLSHLSIKMADSIPAIVGSNQGSEVTPKAKVVEVQEVFDVEDLNNQWDQTFITKQYYVWVPNPKKPTVHTPKSIEPSKTVSTSKQTSEPQPIRSKDVTEQLIPEELERQREEARLKKYASAHSGSSRGTMYSRGAGQRSARPHIDADSLQELLDLPKDVLMSVLEHMEERDLSSRDRVHSVVRQFRTPLESQPSPTSPQMGTSELLRQKKVELLGSKERNYRNHDLMMTKPVFQMAGAGKREREQEGESRGETPVRETASESSIRELNKYKKPLPGIAASSVNKSEGSGKVASISLGLPELPSGLRQTKPFTYKKQQYMDFSLGPVPTPPLSTRSSETGGSDHGTTLRVNMASASTRLQDRDPYSRYSRDGTPMTDSSLPLHTMSPSGTSSKLPKTPMVTPATHSSPTKMSFHRDRTNASQNVSHSPPPSRDISMSPIQRMTAPANSPNQSPAASPEPGSRGLVTIPEMSPAGGKIVSFVCEVPAPPPASMDDQHTYTISLSHLSQPPESLPHTSPRIQGSYETKTNNGRQEVARSCQSPSSSHEEWPNVTEEAYQNSTYPELYIPDARPTSERGSKTPASKPRSSIPSRESDKSSIARIMMDENNVKTESPGPPPPSPEPKDRRRSADERKSQDVLSRESMSMAPLYEESEAGEVSEQGKSDRCDPGVMTTVSEVTPQPKKRREISVDTFVNVDIQANSPRDDGQSTFRSGEENVSGQVTERMVTDKPNEDEFANKEDFNENRASSVISRETTNLRHMEPESTSGMDLAAVNYEHQNLKQDSALTQSENISALRKDDNDTSLKRQEDCSSNQPAEDAEESVNQTSSKELQQGTSNPEPDSDAPVQAEDKEQGESEIDINIPPPVSRTNTAIEIVRTVMESAASNVEELNQNENEG